MGRLIDAEAFKTQGAIATVQQGLNVEKMTRLFALIDAQPTVDAEPIRHGEWVDEDGRYVCSLCGGMAMYGFMGEEQILTRGCPDCRARMKGAQDDD